MKPAPKKTTKYTIPKLKQMFSHVNYKPTSDDWELSRDELNDLYIEKRNDYYEMVDAISAEKRGI